MALLKKAGVWGLRFQIEHKHVVSTEHLLLSTFPLGGWMLGVRQECLQDEHLRKTPGAASHTLPWWMTFHMHCCHLSPRCVLSDSTEGNQSEAHSQCPLCWFFLCILFDKRPQSCVGLNGEPPRKLCNLGVGLETPNIRCPVNLILSRQASLTSSYILMHSVHSPIHSFMPTNCQMWSWMLAT